MNPTRLEEVSSWIEEIERAVEDHGFNVPGFLKPFHFGALASRFQSCGAAGIELSGPLQAFATRMHLWKALGLKPPVGIEEHDPTGRFLPLTALHDQHATDEYSDQLCTIPLAQGEITEETAKSLKIALMEMLNNCFDHAGVQPGCQGMTCAQAWPKGKRAQIAVVDPGVGIRSSLSRNEQLRSRLASLNACELATELHVTGNPSGHSGYGLTLAKQLIHQNGGNFILVSGSEAFRLDRNGPSTLALPTPWQGTIVILEWRTDQPLDIGAVYEGWPLPEGMTREDLNI